MACNSKQNAKTGVDGNRTNSRKLFSDNDIREETIQRGHENGHKWPNIKALIANCSDLDPHTKSALMIIGDLANDANQEAG